MIKKPMTGWTAIFVALISIAQAQPIRLHPQNGHYFLFRGQPTVLITSAEHYGAVLNLDFDYLPYLDALQAGSLNYTRLFTGSYVEIPGSFDISKNTLAPLPNRFLAPWQRSSQPGYVNGGNRFDLNQWDEAYFNRLKDFVSQAGKRGIVVEISFFTSLYNDNGWKYSPLNAINNVNHTDSLDRKKVQTLENGNLLNYQEKLVRKIVRELNGFDNVFYEIQNEPWSDHPLDVGTAVQQREPEANQPWQRKVEVADQASQDWQARIASFVTGEEASLPNRHLIAQNIANFWARITNPNPAVSIFNFHYAHPPAATDNYALNKVIGFDESGFAGSTDSVYRRQAWRFVLSGGGLFNNLDYSFTTSSEKGTEIQKAPGGGSPALRKQLKVLKEFIHACPFLAMRPDQTTLQRVKGATGHGLASAGKAYAFFFEGGSKCTPVVSLPTGNYRAEWIDTQDGKVLKKEQFSSQGGERSLESPPYREDVALRIGRVEH